MKMFKHAALAGLITATALPAAHAVMITGGFTGNWFNTDTSGQGFQLQVLPDGKAVAFWFTYDANGNQVWLIGNDEIVDDRLEMEMLRPLGARFGSGFDPNDVNLMPFGSVTLTFQDCNQGTVNWESDDPQFGFGSMPIERLTRSAGVACTGSVADNRSGSDNIIDFRMPLFNEGIFPIAKGRADYESRPGRVEFDVEIEDVPEGAYVLLIDGVERGLIDVLPSDDGSEGEIEFSSPQDDGELLLEFEPLGALIEVTAGDTVLFSGILDPEFDPGPPNDDDDDDGDEGESDFIETETEIDLVSTGLDPDASGDAEFEQRSDRVEFSVEIEDLDVGVYELWVGDQLRAEIQVVDFGDGTEGEVEFRDPPESGKLPLEFDPLGQVISIEQAGAVFLSANFPAEPLMEDEGNEDEGNEDEGNEDEGNEDEGNEDEGNEDDGSEDDDDDDEDDDEDDDDDDDDDEENDDDD